MLRKERVAIIGAGIQGVCTALFLQKKGYNVTLFDRDEPGNAASYGNAGHFSPYAVLKFNRPDIICKKVDLPDPEGPIIPIFLTPFTEKLSWDKTLTIEAPCK